MASAATFLVLFLAATLPAALALNYNVGDNNNWSTGFNYINWAQGKTFRVGDTLTFRYTSSQHDVTEVNQSDYDSCRGTSPIRMYPLNGNTVVALNSTGTRYLICTFPGHCSQGQMKLAVTVSAGGSSQPSPTPTQSPSSQSVPGGGGGPSASSQPPPNDNSSVVRIGYSMSAIGISALVMVLALVH